MEPTVHQMNQGFKLSGVRRRAVLSLAPLIDVTFILLVFFMLVTQFSRAVPLDVELGALEPALSLPKSAEGESRQSLLRLTVHANGRVDFADFKNLKIQQLAEAIAATSRVLESGETMPKIPVVLIDPDETVPLQLLIDVIEEVQRHPEFTMKVVIRGHAGGTK